MKRGEFDVIHSFGRLAALSPVLPKRLLPKIQSYQREIPWKGVGQAVRLGGKSIWFTACSSGMYRSGDCGRWRTIFNGVDLLKYRFSASVAPDAPLAFLGRLEPIKGAHNAIAIARAAARPLVIAGNRVASCEAYFEREIAPWLNRDGISYAGPVDDQAKSDLLGRCAALLMPIEWEEPFGIVMAEALACGTPVIAFSRGSAPEVVQDGVNGYLRRDTSEAAAAVECLNRLNRADIRRDCETRFGSEAIVDQYESLYQEAVAASGLAN
jgi:glycosyltransferase involved in cell wall biosynthesis